jgi:hypothetical protein
VRGQRRDLRGLTRGVCWSGGNILDGLQLGSGFDIEKQDVGIKAYRISSIVLPGIRRFWGDRRHAKREKFAARNNFKPGSPSAKRRRILMLNLL